MKWHWPWHLPEEYSATSTEMAGTAQRAVERARRDLELTRRRRPAVERLADDVRRALGARP